MGSVVKSGAPEQFQSNVSVMSPARAAELSRDQGFVFRDFEISKIRMITETIRAYPVRMTLVYLAVILFWTVFMSYGSALHGPNTIAVNLSPQVCLFTICVGLLLYPRNLTWVPVVSQCGMYFVPFVLPFTGKPTWLAMPEVTSGLVLFFLITNVLAGLVVGGIARSVYWRIGRRFRPNDTDLLIGWVITVGFASACFVQVHIAQAYAATLVPEHLPILGFDENFVDFSMNRVLRGSSVVVGFFVAVLYTGRLKAVARYLPAMAIFPVLAVLHRQDMLGYPMLDTAIVGLVYAMILPAGVAPIIVIAGITIYSALTGQYLTDTPPGDIESALLENYSIGSLFLIVGTMALRGRGRHERAQRSASLRRLSLVREFAGVGLFAVNIPRNSFRIEASGQTLLGLESETTLDAFVETVAMDHRRAVREAFVNGSHETSTMVVPLFRTFSEGQERLMRLHLWGENSIWKERIVYGLLIEVTDEYRRERALQNALKELSLRQERQNQLFSIVSHEVRTPASVLSMLIAELDRGEDVEELRPQMREASNQLLTVLDDMRQAVNPEKNQKIKISPYVPAELAEQVVSTYRMMAQTRNFEIKTQLGEGADRSIMGDVSRIKQVLGNLVRNAIIHSKGSKICISYERRTDDGPEGTNLTQVCWTVSDDGVGVPAADVARLFQPFERGNADARNQADGSGLGLYIAKQMIEMLGGQLSYFPSPNGGAGYRIVMPEVVTPAGRSKSVVSEDKYFDDRLKAMRVVLAEDNMLVAKITLKQLGRVFGQIDHYENGLLALERIKEDPPDLLLTDLFMPEMPGDELMANVKILRPDLPMIGLTAAVVGDDTRRFEEVGATAYLPKPLSIEKLKRILHDQLA